jgi:MFS family permease
MNLALAGINIISIMVTLTIIDRVGRRPMLLIGAAVQTVALITMGGGLGTPSEITDAHKIGIVTMLAFMSVGFSIGWAPLCYVVTTELPWLKLRDDTLRLGFFVNVCLK